MQYVWHGKILMLDVDRTYVRQEPSLHMLSSHYRELPAMILSINTGRYAPAEIQRREQSLHGFPPKHR